MKSLSKSRFDRVHMVKQRGVVLFFALISLLAIMLAAVALIRSVDTSTMIAGNLAFKQAATTSGDAGTEAAINWLTTMQAANIARRFERRYSPLQRHRCGKGLLFQHRCS
jgi:Tfp pilus assembly protein PilX